MLSSTPNHPNRKDVWGYTFDWTPSHLTASDLHPLTLSYDKLTDDCLDEFDKPGLTSFSFRAKISSSSSNPKSQPQQNGSSNGCPMSQTDFYTLLSSNATSQTPNHVLSRLWDQLTIVPSWVSYPQIARGQAVFYRYAGPAITSLTFHSLLGGMASQRVVETLARTGGFGVNVARRRLLETFQHILDVTEGVESMKPGGRGWVSTVRVRFLHASVRRRIMSLSQTQKDGRRYYDTQKYGIPINDLDSIGTIASFSSALIWVGLPRQGILLTSQEIEDYLALWRYVAYLIGVPDTINLPDGRVITPFGSAPEAKVMIESMVLSELNSPSETSCVLANNIIAALANQPPLRSSESFLRAQAYWLNGSRLCQTLKIPRPPVWHTVLVVSQCLFFMAFCYFRQVHYLLMRCHLPWCSKGGEEEENVTGLERYQRVRRLMRHVVVELAGGKEAKFGFEWVPERGKYTTSDPGGEGEKREGKLRKKKGGWGEWVSSRYGGSEFRSLKAFLVASTVVGCFVWIGVRGLLSGRLPLFR